MQIARGAAGPRRDRRVASEPAAEGSGADWVRWSNGPHDTYAEHSHPYRKVLVCVSGSIAFRLAGGEVIRLGPGDRMELESGTRHSAVVGPDGCTCVESQA